MNAIIDHYIDRDKSFFQDSSPYNNIQLHITLPTDCIMSIVLPIYNEEKNVLGMLNSLNNQTLDKKLWEIIIVDNNCKDKSPQIVQDFIKQHNLKNFFLIKETIQGVTSARKRGYEEVINRFKHRNTEFGEKYNDHLLISLDCDTGLKPEWLQSYYYNFIKGGAEVMSGDSIWDTSILTQYPLIKKWIDDKITIENKLFEIYQGKLCGNDSAFTISSYMKIGGVVQVYYYDKYEKTIQAPATDDFNMTFEFLKHGYEIVGLDHSNLSTFNLRKCLTSIKSIIDGTMYTSNKHYDNKDQIEQDITPDQFQLLMENTMRGSVVFNLFCNVLMQPSMLDSEDSIKFLGESLTHELKELVNHTKLIFKDGTSPYDELRSYFIPGIYMYFKLGEAIHNKIITYFPQLSYLKYKPLPHVKKYTKLAKNNFCYDQMLYQCAHDEELFDYFNDF